MDRHRENPLRGQHPGTKQSAWPLLSEAFYAHSATLNFFESAELDF
ncbi:hypothetical protein EMIT053CA3_240015 [Pseudomonas donghuensis]